MRKTIVILGAASAAALSACSSGNMHSGHGMESTAGAPAPAMGDVTAAARAMVDRDTARLRAATVAFKSLDAAVAAGYSSEIPRCISHPTLGAMGYHHNNEKLMDDRIEIEKPEVLVYEKTPAGEYKLNGVEYMVPFSAHPRDTPPPTVMGQQLKPFDQGKFWYRHVWAWTDNPAGLFEDWDPKVKC